MIIQTTTLVNNSKTLPTYFICIVFHNAAYYKPHYINCLQWASKDDDISYEYVIILSLAFSFVNTKKAMHTNHIVFLEQYQSHTTNKE